MLDFLLNEITLGVSVLVFIASLVVFFTKKKKLSSIYPYALLVLIGFLLLYFGFIAVVSIAFDSAPSAEPTPTPTSVLHSDTAPIQLDLEVTL